MVQMKERRKNNEKGNEKRNFISHMVQMKVTSEFGYKLVAYFFISHMVQMKERQI